MSSMFNYKPFIIAGSVTGDIHIIRDLALDFDRDVVPGNIP